MYNPLPNKVTTQPDAVETYFCVPFEMLEKFPMSDDKSQLLSLLILGNGNKTIEEDSKPFLYKLIEKRISVMLSYEIDDARLILFLCLICLSPGNAVMYLTYLQYWCKKNNVKSIDLDIFCKEIFPWGFPSEKDLDNLWDNQKVERDSMQSDNLLDYSSAYESIQMPKRRNLFPSISDDGESTTTSY